MIKLMLLSVLFAPVMLPIVAAREKRPALALKKTVMWMVLFNLAYGAGLLLFHPSFSVEQ